MGLWGDKPSELRELTDEIRRLSKEVASLKGERDALAEERKRHEEVLQLRERIETLKIEKARREEEQARKEREVRHEVGLLRKQVEAEQEIARQQAILEVREENLAADRNRFEEQMKFTTARFEREVEYLHKLAGQILERLPNVSAALEVHHGNGDAAVPR